MGERVRLIDICLNDNIHVFEPVWTAITSNKAILPVLSELFPNNKYLLNSSYHLTEELKQNGYVSKPISGRCGENVSIHLNLTNSESNELVNDSTALSQTSTPGRFQDNSIIYQALCTLPKCDDLYIQINTFVANGEFAGTVTRVDTVPIIGLSSDFYALRIINNTEQTPIQNLQ
jgi:glutathionylspermidine amidase/synthetase